MTLMTPRVPTIPTKRIVIVGAGVAGSIMARALAMQAGLEVTCLEQVAPDDRASAGLVIGPNAIKALHMRDPLLASAIGEAGLPWDHWRVSLCSGEVLLDLPLTRVADHGGVRILRDTLYRVLRQAAGNTVRYRCKLLACGASRQDPARSYVVWEQHGQRHRLDDIDLLIAADGRDSPTRSAFDSQPRMHQLGALLFRLLVPDAGAGRIDDYEQWCNGPNRLLAFRLPHGQINIAGSLPPAPGDNTLHAGIGPQALRAAYTPAHARPGPQAGWLIDALCANGDAICWYRMQACGIRFAEPHAQVMYLGDSAHAMAPPLGQGVAQAIEDACSAAELIATSLAGGETSPRAWLTAFEAARLERLRFVMSVAPHAAGLMLGDATEQDRASALGALRQLYCQVALPRHGGPDVGVGPVTGTGLPA
ncbi:FAD-dependent oxidoreductase [Cupriavidus basilensis]|uniref:Putative n-hydroxybenzoate hydroxylase n=1 Tax=Cupriavidus basilensis TaxID=68895 RepID=A0A0C4YLS4_9BURK|nr:NAD(P)/FAD-dependent oxidoreductase [Cupriavidus basilensis]AJG22974.1 Putative n-hydroxybenzoate hydroxylase [Cupriavidus basilensis]